ncbi:hypothetical protein SISNIDRAFT_453801 [Sistotremastrum niveocremeum HHB9708]|uniref:Ig-like domain-containing protein n=1 Tax=Sistotremastrum niveocremeum HHB9708 TaxID=1314777 RepID=A0A164VEL8_9AGAM|nr:hypothetical protein SISNIDRAFT_453801 [Sistotremastrum niveocremeum HHB9708]
MSRFACGLIFLVVLSQLVIQCLAQASENFAWGFSPPQMAQLTECDDFPVMIVSHSDDFQPQPPFYIMAYEVSGIATCQEIGMDPDNLVWQVDHATGSQLLLEMVDANGVSGGVAPALYTIQDGSSSSCHSNVITSPVQISADVTAINSCDPLLLSFGGGTLPYSVTIVTSLGAAITNLTLGDEDNAYNWIDRADPDGILIATVHDANGQYAVGTGVIGLSGVTGATCGSDTSSSGQLANISPGASLPNPATASALSPPSSSPPPEQTSDTETPTPPSSTSNLSTSTTSSATSSATADSSTTDSSTTDSSAATTPTTTSSNTTSSTSIPATPPSHTSLLASTASSPSAVSTTSSSSKSHAGAIAGGVIAGLVALLLLLFYLYRRRERRRDGPAMVELDIPNDQPTTFSVSPPARPLSGNSSVTIRVNPVPHGAPPPVYGRK